MRRQAPGRGRDGVLEQHAVGCQVVNLGRGLARIAVGGDVIGAKGVDDDQKDVGRSWGGSRQMRGRKKFVQAFATFCANKQENKNAEQNRSRTLEKLGDGNFVLLEPAGESHGNAQCKQKARSFVESSSDEQPVISGQRREDENEYSQGAQARENTRNECDTASNQNEQDRIDDWGNPENFFGDVKDSRPLRPVDALK